MIKKISIWILCILCIAGCSLQEKISLPNDLLYQGKPIHPEIIASTHSEAPDSDRPQPVEYQDITLSEYWGGGEKIKEDFSYDPLTNTVTFTLTYRRTHLGVQEWEGEEYSSYQYIGSYQGRHIIFGRTSDTRKMGDTDTTFFNSLDFLGLVKREGNTIKNAGTIAFAGKIWGGPIKDIWHNNNIIHYRKGVDQSTIQDTFEMVLSMPYVYGPCGMSIIYEVNLDVLNNDPEKASKVIGLVLDQEKYLRSYPYNEDEWFEECWATVADRYVKQCKKVLNLDEVQRFFEEVLEETQKRKITPLPQDLIQNGNPIHPSIIASTQYGENSKEPRLIRDITNPPFITSEELKYDPIANRVISKRTYTSACNQIEYLFDSYQYVGSYKEKHIVYGQTYDSAGIERCEFLGLVKRDGNTIQNAGDIAGGDRGEGGNITGFSHCNRILCFSQSASLEMFAQVCTGKKLDVYGPIGSSCGISLVYEVNLAADGYKKDVVGLIFDQDAYPPQDEYTANKHASSREFERCVNAIADVYVKQGKKKLTYAKTKDFFNEIIAQYSTTSQMN